MAPTRRALAGDACGDGEHFGLPLALDDASWEMRQPWQGRRRPRSSDWLAVRWPTGHHSHPLDRAREPAVGPVRISSALPECRDWQGLSARLHLQRSFLFTSQSPGFSVQQWFEPLHLNVATQIISPLQSPTERAPNRAASEKTDKGVAFPTCASANEIVCHFSPLPNESLSLQAGDWVKIDLGCHIDGYVAVVAH
ncbi:hypothetical protein PR003_g25093, partial [Phytophthora rubi]